MKLQQWDLIEITWTDALYGDEGWIWLSEIDWKMIENKMIHKTIGYLVKETPKMIAVCQSYRVEPEQGGKRKGDYSIETPIEIPKPVVIRIKKLKEDRKKGQN